MRRIQSYKKDETSAPATDSASLRHAWPQPHPTIQRPSNEGPRYRLTWRRGPRRPQHGRTWGHLKRGAGVVRDVATREWGFSTDSCGVATLVVEAHGERTYLWRNWQACHYPFVSALLEELGKANPFRTSVVQPTTPISAKASHREKRVGRRNRSLRS